MNTNRQTIHRLAAAGLVVAAAAILAACQTPTPPTPTATPPPTATAAPSPTPTYTPTPSPTPTLTPVPDPNAVLTRGPYLQSVTTHSVVVAWDTDLPSVGEVAYGETEALGSTAACPLVGAHHAVTLTGLLPYTVTHYRVESGGAPLSETYSFRSGAGPEQTTFHFVVYGDTRTNHRAHQEVADRIVAVGPDFAVHTGDLVESGWDVYLWEKFFGVEQALMATIPMVPVFGNHEESSFFYLDYFYLPGNEKWFTFDYGSARFICLKVDGESAFEEGSEQYAWLVEQLAANTQPWLFVAFHIPPYSSVQDDLEDDVRAALTPLFEQYGVDVVFNGHKHNYERNEVNGVTYVVAGGGGAPLYQMDEQEPTQAAFAMEFHLVSIEIDGDQLAATVISSAGETLDTFTRTN